MPECMFASDNTAGIDATVLDAMRAANDGAVISYGDDPITATAIETLRKHFGTKAEIYFTFGGTGANIAALGCFLAPYEALLTPTTSHINMDECGAVERLIGAKVITLQHTNGKVAPSDVAPFIAPGHDEHHVIPAMLSISQSTEFGTAYSLNELRELVAFAHDNELSVHMDGARLSNAAASLSCSLAKMTSDIGIDVVSLGATKNGLAYGEAMVILDSSRQRFSAKHVRKQITQLPSKMRFISAGFNALYAGDRWLENASNANRMAQRLATALQGTVGLELTRPVDCNAIFARLDPAAAARIRRDYAFYTFDERTHEVRWMTSFRTTEADVDRFAECVKAALRKPARAD
jgi:threonine aldolase